MALLEKHRNTIYNAFVPLLGEEAAQAMLSQFPARDVEEPVTKEFLRVELAEVRVELAEVRVEIHELGDRLTNRMLTIAGLGLVAITVLLAVFA